MSGNATSPGQSLLSQRKVAIAVHTRPPARGAMPGPPSPAALAEQRELGSRGAGALTALTAWTRRGSPCVKIGEERVQLVRAEQGIPAEPAFHSACARGRRSHAGAPGPRLPPRPTGASWRSGASSPLCELRVQPAHPPEHRAATEGRTGSIRTLRRVAGARGELWWRWHFCARQRRGASRAGAEGSFRRNFFSTYLSLIQASLSCLDQGWT